ncbi:MAG: hypothetical protein ACOC33_01955 [bacterium]
MFSFIVIVALIFIIVRLIQNRQYDVNVAPYIKKNKYVPDNEPLTQKDLDILKQNRW